MQRCRECEVILTEGRNWHASYAARNYRHCMACARAYSKKRYGRLKTSLNARQASGAGLSARQRVVRDRAVLAKARRDRSG